MSSRSEPPEPIRTVEVRKGQVTEPPSRDVFRERFMPRFYDPAFRQKDEALARLEAIAWDAYSNGRESPVTQKAGPGFADPDYDLSVEWRAASERIKAAQSRQPDPATRSRALVINVRDQS